LGFLGGGAAGGWSATSSIQTPFSVTVLQSPRPKGIAMPRIYRLIVGLLVLVPLAVSVASTVAHAEKRIALVIGNAGYQAGSLNTPANDAGLIAQTLQASGFDVVGARDLDQDFLLLTQCRERQER
jgi:caspase domain-containing protein